MKEFKFDCTHEVFGGNKKAFVVTVEAETLKEAVDRANIILDDIWSKCGCAKDEVYFNNPEYENICAEV